MITKVRGSVLNLEDLLGFISLGEFASPGDDVTDVLDSLLAIGRPIYIPPGIWRIGTVTVPASSLIFGAGASSVLSMKDLNNTLGLSLGSASVLRSFTIEGNKTNQVSNDSHTVSINGVDKVKLVDVNIKNTKGDAIHISGGSTNIEIVRGEISGYTGYGIRVESCTRLTIDSPMIFASDLIASGDGIGLVTNGGTISQVTIKTPALTGVKNRSIAIIGGAGRTVSAVTIEAPKVFSSGTHGINIINAEGITILGGSSINNSLDGLRLEGDVQYCRINSLLSTDNKQAGIREIAGSTAPNNNGFIYCVSRNNIINEITKVGAQSFVV